MLTASFAWRFLQKGRKQASIVATISSALSASRNGPMSTQIIALFANRSSKKSLDLVKKPEKLSILLLRTKILMKIQKTKYQSVYIVIRYAENLLNPLFAMFAIIS